MGLALLLTGLTMNVVGVAVGSSRDLQALGASLLGGFGRARRSLRMSINSITRRLRRQPAPGHSLSVSDAGHVTSSAEGRILAWNPVPDDPLLAVAVLRERTDNLHELLKSESVQRAETLGSLTSEIAELEAVVGKGLSKMETRIDDFDVKPAGQRALGAVLVIAGTALMAVAGLSG